MLNCKVFSYIDHQGVKYEVIHVKVIILSENVQIYNTKTYELLAEIPKKKIQKMFVEFEENS